MFDVSGIDHSIHALSNIRERVPVDGDTAQFQDHLLRGNRFETDLVREESRRR